MNEDSIFANIGVFMPFKEANEHVTKNAKNSSGEMIKLENRPDFEEFTEAVNSKQGWQVLGKKAGAFFFRMENYVRIFIFFNWSYYQIYTLSW